MQNSANQSYLIKLWRSAVIPYLSVVFIVFIITVLCMPLVNTERYYLVSYLLLFALFIMATVFRLGPVLLAATLSSLAWNFFFIPPHNTFHIEKTDDILMFALFFSIAMLNGVLTTRVRRQEQLARDRELRTKVLFQLTHQLSKAGSIDEVLKIAIGEISEQFGFTAFFILQDGNNILYQTGRLQKEKKLNSDFPGFIIRKFQNWEVSRSRFINEVTSAIASLIVGDVLLVHYSGHGTQEMDYHGDEADGYDEAIYLYDGSVIDDDIGNALKSIPDGATVVLMFDSCFSGTITSLLINFLSSFSKRKIPSLSDVLSVLFTRTASPF